jgi:hypothetical protein
MHTTWAGNLVTRTLLFHTYYSYVDTVIGTRTHMVHPMVISIIYLNPTYSPQEQW